MPTFTLGQITAAIPKHCFERNLFTSFSYLFSDLLTILILGYLATFITSSLSIVPYWCHSLLWFIYWYTQGCVMLGVWIIAHECGHQAFSESELINNLVGTICHSLLLVPYHSWRITHQKHHYYTNSCDNDEVFVPLTRSDWIHDMLRDTPIAQAWGIFVMLTIGWMPGYLIFNATGPKKYRKLNSNHFSPNAIFFKTNEYWLIIQTDIMFFIAFALLGMKIY